MNGLKTSELETKIFSLSNSLEKIDAINQLAFEIRNSDTPRSISLSKQSQELSILLNYPNGNATSLANEGFCYVQITDYELALEKLFAALNIFEEQKNALGRAKVHYNLCLIYSRISDIDSALDSINKTIAYYKKENNDFELARCYFQLGHLYRLLNDSASAIDCHNYSIELNIRIKNSAGEAASLMGLGLVYLKLTEYKKCNESLVKCLSIQEKIKDWRGYAASLNAYMTLCMATGKFEEAEKSAIKGIELETELGDKMGISRLMVGLGKIYFEQKKINLAEEKTLEALSIAVKINLRIAIAPSHLLLSEIYQYKGDFEKALKHHQLFFKVNEEMVNTDAAVKAKSFQLISKIENAHKEAEINRLKNVELKNAFEEIQEKNKEITASITYALRIQTAILPPQKIVENYFENSFIIYKPKDIVAGDFYWMETVNDIVLFAACDCTGHGVPGAMVSVVCHNALNRAVREFGLIEPAKILDKTAEIIIENFSKSKEGINDGMDISLCAYNPKTKILQWAGANNPLWLIQNDELIEIKANKQPIGMYDNYKLFTNHQYKLKTRDSLYLFTDGFADQFGGENGKKKLTKKRFKDLILSIQDKSLHQQGIYLENFINEYKIKVEQIDDILVIGFKV
ncbi:MAG: SpoIIE family protein phosphatase [Bacteroidota bacterium]